MSCGAHHRPDDRGWCTDCEHDCAPELRREVDAVVQVRDELKAIVAMRDAEVEKLRAVAEAARGYRDSGSSAQFRDMAKALDNLDATPDQRHREKE